MRTFVAACEAGSFTAAANRLGMSKKLVSKYVGELEERLGVKLMHRTTRTLSLTDAGQRYYERCIRLIAEIDALESGLREEEGAITGQLRLAAATSFGELHIQPALCRFRELHPEIRVTLQLSDRYVDLADEGFDLAVRIGTLDETRMVARRLGTTELWAVAAPGYLEAAGVPSTPSDLAGHSCIRDLNLRSGADWPFVVDGQKKRFPVSASFEVNSATATKNLSVAGEGIALCPDYVVAGDVRDGRLIRVLPSYNSLSLDIHAVYLDARYMPRRVRALIDFLVVRFRGKTDWAELKS